MVRLQCPNSQQVVLTKKKKKKKKRIFSYWFCIITKVHCVMLLTVKTEYKNIKVNESYSHLKETMEIHQNNLRSHIWWRQHKRAQYFEFFFRKNLYYNHGIIHAKIYGVSMNTAEITEGGHNVPPPSSEKIKIAQS